MILRRPPPPKKDEEWPKKCDFPRQQNEPLDENEQAPIPTFSSCPQNSLQGTEQIGIQQLQK